jgi:hypothetical protein
MSHHNHNHNNSIHNNSNNLSDQMLTETLLNLTVSERHTTLELILSLAEFDNRKLFAATHSSLFSYATQQLKMSEGEAQRRIDGARLLRSMPVFIKSYETGELNLTHASLLRRHFRTEARVQKKKLSYENQFELVQKLLGKSTREAERILVAVSSRPELQKSTEPGEKLLKNGNYRVQFETRPELIAKSERLKEIWSHSMSGATWPEIIERAFDLVIEKCDPNSKAKRQHQRLERARQSSQSEKQKMSKKESNEVNSECKTEQCLDDGSDHKYNLDYVQNLEHNQNSISESDVISNSGADNTNSGADNTFDVDPITGEIQLRLPLPVNETQSEVKSQLARTVGTGYLPLNNSRRLRTFMPLGASKCTSAIPLTSN